MKRTIIAGAVVAGILALAGCDTAVEETPAEAAYLNDVYTFAKAEGFTWTRDLQDATAEMGEATCELLRDGGTVDDILENAEIQESRDGRVVRYAIEQAPVTLCPEVR